MRSALPPGSLAAVLVALLLGSAAAQPQDSRRIQARDGDVVVVEDGDSIRIVRRRRGEIRAIYNPQQNWLVLLADYSPRVGAERDGGVDTTYSFHELTGIWPLGERWQGLAVVDETTQAAGPAPRGLRLETAQGVVHLLGWDPRQPPISEDGVTIHYRGMGTGGSAGDPFDIAEQRKVAEAARNAEMRANLPGGAPATNSGIQFGAGGVTSGHAAQPPRPPYRVGRSVSPPRLLTRVDPILPATARQAGIQGTVLLEVVVDLYGEVAAAKVLRSIPLLDEAAVAAVKQWRYEPGRMNGDPVAVLLTVAVEFKQ